MRDKEFYLQTMVYLFPFQNLVSSANSQTGTAPTSQAPSPTLTPEEQGAIRNVVYIGIGLGVAVAILISAAIVLISVTICLRKRSRKNKLPDATENDAYGLNQFNMVLKDNTAYTSTNTTDGNEGDDGEYEYISSGNTTATTSN